MIANNGTLETVVGNLVERCNEVSDNVVATEKTCKICGVEEWAKYTGGADVAVIRYTGACGGGDRHTIERVEITVDLTYETTLTEKWKETCPNCDRRWALDDLDIHASKQIGEYKIGVPQVRKTRFEEHHTSYIPEETISLCASCHTKVHNKDGFHDDMKPDISRGQFEQVKND